MLAALALTAGLLTGLTLLTAGLAVAAVATTVRLGHFILILQIFINAAAGGVKKLTAPRPHTNSRGTMATAASPLRILLLDTETNGLPANRYAPITEAGAWPAILQLSWMEFEVSASGEMTPIHTRDIGIALHPSIPWNADAAKIHGISEIEGRSGTPATTALLELGEALRGTRVVVAHNLAFDKSVIRAAAYAEWLRGGPAELREIWPRDIRELCTMRETQAIVRIPSPYYGAASGKFKPPRLNELYTWLYGYAYDISGAVLHTSSSDTHCLSQCLSELIRRGLLIMSDGTIKSSSVSS